MKTVEEFERDVETVCGGSGSQARLLRLMAAILIEILRTLKSSRTATYYIMTNSDDFKTELKSNRVSADDKKEKGKKGKR